MRPSKVLKGFTKTTGFISRMIMLNVSELGSLVINNVTKTNKYGDVIKKAGNLIGEGLDKNINNLGDLTGVLLDESVREITKNKDTK